MLFKLKQEIHKKSKNKTMACLYTKKGPPNMSAPILCPPSRIHKSRSNNNVPLPLHESRDLDSLTLAEIEKQVKTVAEAAFRNPKITRQKIQINPRGKVKNFRRRLQTPSPEQIEVLHVIKDDGDEDVVPMVTKRMSSSNRHNSRVRVIEAQPVPITANTSYRASQNNMAKSNSKILKR